jgi:phosphohistidine phosphatase SixA
LGGAEELMHIKLKQLTAILVFAFMAASAMASELADKLKLPNYALLMRHALAPGTGDPTGYTLKDCNTQRNLDAQGKQQAVRTGQWLQRQGIQQAMVLTSPWCRCKDTANLLGYGQPEVEPAIGSFFEASQQAADYTQRLQKRLAQLGPTKGDKALILVTHHVNILDYMGSHVGSGEMVLVQFDAQGKLISAKRYPSPI